MRHNDANLLRRELLAMNRARRIITTILSRMEAAGTITDAEVSRSLVAIEQIADGLVTLRGIEQRVEEKPLARKE